MLSRTHATALAIDVHAPTCHHLKHTLGPCAPAYGHGDCSSRLVTAFYLFTVCCCPAAGCSRNSRIPHQPGRMQPCCTTQADAQPPTTRNPSARLMLYTSISTLACRQAASPCTCPADARPAASATPGIINQALLLLNLSSPQAWPPTRAKIWQQPTRAVPAALQPPPPPTLTRVQHRTQVPWLAVKAPPSWFAKQSVTGCAATLQRDPSQHHGFATGPD